MWRRDALSSKEGSRLEVDSVSMIRPETHIHTHTHTHTHSCVLEGMCGVCVCVTVFIGTNSDERLSLLLLCDCTYRGVESLCSGSEPQGTLSYSRPKSPHVIYSFCRPVLNGCMCSPCIL